MYMELYKLQKTDLICEERVKLLEEAGVTCNCKNKREENWQVMYHTLEDFWKGKQHDCR